MNGHRFINNASIGLYPHIVSKRQRQQERLGRRKWFAALVAAASVFRRYPLLRVVLDTGGRTIPRTTPFVFVGNNRYTMDLLAENGREALDRGELGVYFTRRTGRFGLLWLALRALFGRLEQARDFESMALPELTVDTPKKTLRIALDGEVSRLSPPLKFRVLAGALRWSSERRAMMARAPCHAELRYSAASVVNCARDERSLARMTGCRHPLRHSGFVIDSSFELRHSSFPP